MSDTPNDIYINAMTLAYLEAALFTADEDIIPPKSGEFDASPYMWRFSAAVKAQARAVCSDFATENAADLVDYPADDAGHDLWFTRNGHGVGYWENDHCTDEQGERLTAAAERLGEVNVVQGRDGWLYIE